MFYINRIVREVYKSMSKDFKQWFASLWELGYSFQIECTSYGNCVLVNIVCEQNKQKKYFFFQQEKYFYNFIEELKGCIKKW